MPRLCLEQQEERGYKPRWRKRPARSQWVGVGPRCSFEQVRFGGVHETSKGRAGRHRLDRSAGPEEMYRLEINMGSHQQDLLVFRTTVF